MKGSVTPSLGHHTCPVVRPNLSLVNFNDAIKRSRVHVAFAGQQSFQGAHTHVHFAQMAGLIGPMRVVMVIGQKGSPQEAMGLNGQERL
jgi:hypothetical protein